MGRKKMSKPSEKTVDNFDYVTTELEKLHPEKGDIFILNVHTDDPDILYSDDILQSVEKLSETLEDLIGIRIPILVFGNEIDLSLLSKDELIDLIDRLEELGDELDDDDDEEHPEQLINQFS